MWKISTSERSTMQSNGSSLQKLWNQRTLWKGVYVEVKPLGRSSKHFQWFWSWLLRWIWWTCLCSDTSSSCKGDTQEETPHPVSNKCQLRESEEAGGRPLSYCFLKADTGADVNLLNSNTFGRIIGDRPILQPSTYKMKAYGSSTVAVLGKFYIVYALCQGHSHSQATACPSS